MAMDDVKVTLTASELGTLAMCAIRYCQGRQSYMPSMVQRILLPHLRELSNRDLAVMIADCEFQKSKNLYGDENIDKPDWIRWEKALLTEKDRRRDKED